MTEGMTPGALEAGKLVNAMHDAVEEALTENYTDPDGNLPISMSAASAIAVGACLKAIIEAGYRLVYAPEAP